MSSLLGRLFGAQAPQGPSQSQLAAQRMREDRANRDRAEADRSSALALRVGSRRRSLAFQDRERQRKETLGG